MRRTALVRPDRAAVMAAVGIGLVGLVIVPSLLIRQLFGSVW